jgi:hypothetical protein
VAVAVRQGAAARPLALARATTAPVRIVHHDDALVARWPFDDGPASALARDRSGHGTDCDFHEADPATRWTDGPGRGAVSLDGQGWLSCPGPRFAPDPAATLTVALWVKRIAPAPGYHAVVTRQLGRGRLDHFFVGFRGDSILIDSHVWTAKLHHPAPPLDRWFHLAMVHGHGELVLYLDGLAVARQPSHVGRPIEGDAAITVGAGVNGPDREVGTQRFTGAVADLFVYQRALSPAEIAALAAAR